LGIAAKCIKPYTLRGDAQANKTSLTLPLFIVSVQRQESERSCISVLGVWILPLSTIFRLDFGTVSTMG